MRIHGFSGLCAVLGLLATGCAPDFEYLGTEVSQVCVRGVPLSFDGAQQGMAVARVNLASTGLAPDELDGGTITLDSIALTAGPEIQDFAFADRVQVSLSAGLSSPDVASPDVALPDVALIDMQSVGDAPSLHVAGDPDLDLTDHLLAQDASMDVAFAGQMPASAWTARLDVCLAVDGVDSAAAGL